jgi:hypothetical protein
VSRMLDVQKKRLAADRDWLKSSQDRLAEAQARLDRAFSALMEER